MISNCLRLEPVSQFNVFILVTIVGNDHLTECVSQLADRDTSQVNMK